MSTVRITQPPTVAQPAVRLDSLFSHHRDAYFKPITNFSLPSAVPQRPRTVNGASSSSPNNLAQPEPNNAGKRKHEYVMSASVPPADNYTGSATTPNSNGLGGVGSNGVHASSVVPMISVSANSLSSPTNNSSTAASALSLTAKTASHASPNNRSRSSRKSSLHTTAASAQTISSPSAAAATQLQSSAAINISPAPVSTTPSQQSLSPATTMSSSGSSTSSSTSSSSSAQNSPPLLPMQAHVHGAQHASSTVERKHSSHSSSQQRPSPQLQSLPLAHDLYRSTSHEFMPLQPHEYSSSYNADLDHALPRQSSKQRRRRTRSLTEAACDGYWHVGSEDPTVGLPEGASYSRNGLWVKNCSTQTEISDILITGSQTSNFKVQARIRSPKAVVANSSVGMHNSTGHSPVKKRSPLSFLTSISPPPQAPAIVVDDDASFERLGRRLREKELDLRQRVSELQNHLKHASLSPDSQLTFEEQEQEVEELEVILNTKIKELFSRIKPAHTHSPNSPTSSLSSLISPQHSMSISNGLKPTQKTPFYHSLPAGFKLSKSASESQSSSKSPPSPPKTLNAQRQVYAPHISAVSPSTKRLYSKNQQSKTKRSYNSNSLPQNFKLSHHAHHYNPSAPLNGGSSTTVQTSPTVITSSNSNSTSASTANVNSFVANQHRARERKMLIDSKRAANTIQINEADEISPRDVLELGELSSSISELVSIEGRNHSKRKPARSNKRASNPSQQLSALPQQQPSYSHLAPIGDSSSIKSVVAHVPKFSKPTAPLTVSQGTSPPDQSKAYTNLPSPRSAFTTVDMKHGGGKTN